MLLKVCLLLCLAGCVLSGAIPDQVRKYLPGGNEMQFLLIFNFNNLHAATFEKPRNSQRIIPLNSKRGIKQFQRIYVDKVLLNFYYNKIVIYAFEASN